MEENYRGIADVLFAHKKEIISNIQCKEMLREFITENDLSFKSRNANYEKQCENIKKFGYNSVYEMNENEKSDIIALDQLKYEIESHCYKCPDKHKCWNSKKRVPGDLF